MATSSSFDGIDLDDIYAFTVQLAKEAGQMLLKAAETRCGQSGQAGSVEKDSAVDIVTQTDEGTSSSHMVFDRSWSRAPRSIPPFLQPECSCSPPTTGLRA